MYKPILHRRHARNGAAQPASERSSSRARVDFSLFSPLISRPYDRLMFDNKNLSRLRHKTKMNHTPSHSTLSRQVAHMPMYLTPLPGQGGMIIESRVTSVLFLFALLTCLLFSPLPFCYVSTWTMPRQHKPCATVRNIFRSGVDLLSFFPVS